MRPFVAMVVSFLVVSAGVFGIGEAAGVWDMKPLEAAEDGDGVEVPPGWQVHRAAGVSVALPASWRVLSAREGWSTNRFRRENLKLAAYTSGVRGRTPNSKLMAFDTGPLGKTIVRRDGFATNFGIIKAPVSLSRAQIWKRDLAGLRGMPGRIGPVETTRTELAGGPALAVRLHLRLRTPKPLVILLAQWIVVSDGYHYILSFGTSQRAERQYAGVLAQVVETLRLPEETSRPAP